MDAKKKNYEQFIEAVYREFCMTLGLEIVEFNNMVLRFVKGAPLLTDEVPLEIKKLSFKQMLKDD